MSPCHRSWRNTCLLLCTAVLMTAGCNRCSNDEGVTMATPVPTPSVQGGAAADNTPSAADANSEASMGAPHAVYKQAYERARREINPDNAHQVLNHIDDQIVHEREAMR